MTPAPHLRQRACDAVFACAVCPRPVFALVKSPDGFVALCLGCLTGYERALADPREPKEALQ